MKNKRIEGTFEGILSFRNDYWPLLKKLKSVVEGKGTIVSETRFYERDEDINPHNLYNDTLTVVFPPQEVKKDEEKSEVDSTEPSSNNRYDRHHHIVKNFFNFDEGQVEGKISTEYDERKNDPYLKVTSEGEIPKEVAAFVERYLRNQSALADFS